MTGPHVDQTTRVDVGVDHLLTDQLRADQTGLVLITEFVEADLFVLERCELRRSVGQLAEAPAQVALDGVLGDALAHQFHRIDAGALQIPYAFVADVTGKAFDLVTDAANQLTAVAPAGTPANASGFNQYHRQPALRQFNRGVDPGEAAADHADIGGEVTVECRPGRTGPGRSCVIGAGVFLAVLIHLFDFTLLQDRVIRRMIDWGGVEEM